MFLDGACASLAVFLAFIFRWDMNLPRTEMPHLWIWIASVFVGVPLAIAVRGGYHSTWQHFGAHDFLRLARRLSWVSAVMLVATFFTPAHHATPYGVIVIDYLLMVSFSAGIRLLRRLDHEALLRLTSPERILVVATARTVSGALHQLRPLYGPAICGVVLAEDEGYEKLRIAGTPVLGDLTDLRDILQQQQITMLFLCSTDFRNLEDVMQTAADYDVSVKMLPSVQDLLAGRVRVSKNISAAALSKEQEALGEALHPAVEQCFEGKTVLITGAAGSIGSELVRQVSASSAARLLLLDQDENGIFELLGELGKRPNLQPVIADIRQEEAIRNVFQRERPHIVLHAAAYKHVPLMEAHPSEAVLNNVIGTRNLAEAAVAFGAERMVMISSDKAVRPSSVMGASKRLAEVVIQDLAARSRAQGSQTDFACVRFGNVLGSRGSVVPIFLKQIENGGPITITNEQMTRYFMTIPQAVRLVLQAATLASCGHIYMLDMGDPVRIINLAHQIIQLAGLTPDKDIAIQITGSRPGEKLHEQLWAEDAQVSQTHFEHLFEVLATGAGEGFTESLVELERAAHEHRSPKVLELMRRLPIDYRTERSVNASEESAAIMAPAAR
jgi:FlaA1/EpsC-like NDP-sugar epimerase